MKNTPHIANAGEAGARFYSALTGIAPPRNDNATTGNRGEVGKAKQTGKANYSGKKRLPAYAKPLADMRRQGLAPAEKTILIRLDRWLPQDHPASVAWPQCVIPPDSQPSEFDFGFVRDLDTVICWWQSQSDESRLRSLAREVLRFNPRCLTVLDIELGQPWFIKSLSRGVEVEL